MQQACVVALQSNGQPLKKIIIIFCALPLLLLLLLSGPCSEQLLLLLLLTLGRYNPDGVLKPNVMIIIPCSQRLANCCAVKWRWNAEPALSISGTESSPLYLSPIFVKYFYQKYQCQTGAGKLTCWKRSVSVAMSSVLLILDDGPLTEVQIQASFAFNMLLHFVTLRSWPLTFDLILNG